MLRRISSGTDWLLHQSERGSLLIGMLALWTIVSLVLMQVGNRLLMQRGLPWPEELARFLHITLVFMCLAYVMRKGEHLQVDIFLSRLPHRVQLASRLLFTLAIAATAAFMAYGGWVLIERLGHTRTPALRMSVALFFTPTLIGFALLTLESIAQSLALARDTFGRGSTQRPAASDEG